MNYITGTIGNAGNVINTSYTQLDRLEVQYEGTDTWLDCSVAGNISNKSNTSFTIRVKDGQIVTNMSNMFQNCSSLTSLDLSNFDTSNVTNMHAMFYHCNSLTSLDVSNFDTSKVTNMGAMFYHCSSLTSLDLSNFDTSKVTNYSNMLVGASALEVINLSYANQDTISVILDSVPSQAITVKTTPENMAYATDTAPSNVTVIDVISTIRISTTKQQLLYNILYGIQNANIVPHDTEELILYGIMMNQDVDVRLDTIVQILYYNLLKKGV